MKNVKEFKVAQERKIKIDLNEIAAVEQINDSIAIYLKTGHKIFINGDYLIDKCIYEELL